MKQIILDSSALIALNSIDDSNHKKALEISQELTKEDCNLIIPADIFVETVNVAGRIFNREKQLNLVEDLQSSDYFTILSSFDLLEEALTILKTNAAKTDLSLTDCIVVACAKSWDTNYIFTFDKSILKLGFELPT
jgi:predicted nucleic acid-binding protein